VRGLVDVGVCFWWWLGLLGDLGAGLFFGDWFELGIGLFDDLYVRLMCVGWLN